MGKRLTGAAACCCGADQSSVSSSGNDCARCISGDMPPTKQVALDGVVEKSPDRCPGDCTDYNTTWTLTQGGDSCFYDNTDADFCFEFEQKIQLIFEPSAGDVLVVGRIIEDDGEVARWEKLIEGDENDQIDCEDIGELDRVVAEDEGTGYCDHTNTTFEVL